LDTLTHALSGALLARATAGLEKPALPLGRRIAIGAAVGAFPDIDVVASWISPLAYLYHHRGITHSLLMLPLWTVLLALLLAAVFRNGPRWKTYVPVVALSLLVHIAGDWITTFGTMIFAPLSDHRFELGTTFIIDLWFSGIIVTGLAGSLLWRRSRLPAVAALAVLVAYVGLQYANMREAVDFGERAVRELGLGPAQRVSALPRPVSPYNWMVILEYEDGYRYAHVNLRRQTLREAGPEAGFIARLDAVYRPLARAQWETALRYGRGGEAAAVRAAFDSPSFAFFRWFSAYPALHSVELGERDLCIWFHDLRFVTPGRGSLPFVYGLCGEAGAAMKPYQLEDGQRVAVY
jgi:inner membrane protein